MCNSIVEIYLLDLESSCNLLLLFHRYMTVCSLEDVFSEITIL